MHAVSTRWRVIRGEAEIGLRAHRLRCAYLRQHLPALAEQRVDLGALVLQQAGLRGLDHRKELWASLSRVTVT